MVLLTLMGTKTDGDIAQALAIRQLGKGHHQIVVEAPKMFDLPCAVGAAHISVERMEGQVIHNLRKMSEPVYIIFTSSAILRWRMQRVCLVFKSVTPLKRLLGVKNH